VVWKGGKSTVVRAMLATAFTILIVSTPCGVAYAGVLTMGERGVWETYSSPSVRTFPHVVLITLDGASKLWVDRLIVNNTLPTLASLKAEGVELAVRIVDHQTVTDAGLACIESGYGPGITGVDQNYFASTTKKSVPDGLTTGERIKETYPTWKVGLVMPWTQGRVNVTSSVDSTLWNQKGETDYWFASENVTWSLSDPDVRRNSLDFFSALLTAGFVSSKVAEFISANKGDSFYIRAHFVEPDHAGHANSEAVSGRITPEYREALVACDRALKTIVDALEDAGIYDDTVILVTTDHGFFQGSHSGSPYPFGEDDVTTVWLVSNRAEVRNPLGWILQNDISPTCLALAGADPDSFTPAYSQTSHALAAWVPNETLREVTPPSIASVNYPSQTSVGESLSLTVTVTDASGVYSVILMYNYSTVGWRGLTLTKLNGTAFSGSVGPFNQEFTVYWYVKAVDGSISGNVAYYPADAKPVATPVRGAVPYWTLLPVAALVVAAVGSLLYLRRRKFGARRTGLEGHASPA